MERLIIIKNATASNGNPEDDKNTGVVARVVRENSIGPWTEPLKLGTGTSIMLPADGTLQVVPESSVEAVSISPAREAQPDAAQAGNEANSERRAAVMVPINLAQAQQLVRWVAGGGVMLSIQGNTIFVVVDGSDVATEADTVMLDPEAPTEPIPSPSELLVQSNAQALLDAARTADELLENARIPGADGAGEYAIPAVPSDGLTRTAGEVHAQLQKVLLDCGATTAGEVLADQKHDSQQQAG